MLVTSTRKVFSFKSKSQKTNQVCHHFYQIVVVLLKYILFINTFLAFIISLSHNTTLVYENGNVVSGENP